MTTLVKQCRKAKGTLKLYFNTYSSQWTISFTPFLTPESSRRRLIKPGMAAHIIAKVNSPF